MSDNILKKSLAVTYEDFLNGVFGKRGKPEWRALMTLFSEIVTGRSTLVSDLSKPLRENASLAECKRVQERVSGWFANYDFVEDTGGSKGRRQSADAGRILRKSSGERYAMNWTCSENGCCGGALPVGVAEGRDGREKGRKWRFWAVMAWRK